MDQLAVSWKESTHEGDCLGGKTRQIFSNFSLFSSVFAHTVDMAPKVGFWQSWCPWKACDTLFLKVLDLQEVGLGFERYGLANRSCWSVSPYRKAVFPIKILATSGKILAIWEFHVVSERILFLKVPDLQIKLQRAGKNLCAKATLPGGKLWNFQHGLLSSVSFRAYGWHSSWC